MSNGDNEPERHIVPDNLQIVAAENCFSSAMRTKDIVVIIISDINKWTRKNPKTETYAYMVDRRTAEVNEPNIDRERDRRTHANRCVSLCAFSSMSLSLSVQCKRGTRRKMTIASQMSSIKKKPQRNLCFLSMSSSRQALINKLVGRRTDLLPLLILDERVSNRIYANQLVRQLRVLFSSFSRSPRRRAGNESERRRNLHQKLINHALLNESAILIRQ